MSGSVAARLVDDEKFFTALQRLEQEFAIKGKDLVTFMSNSAAVALYDETFLTAFQRLEQELAIKGKDLVTFLSGSVAARLVDDEKFNRFAPSAGPICTVVWSLGRLDFRSLGFNKTLKNQRLGKPHARDLNTPMGRRPGE